ncbi:hypothetical protein Poli38472_005793 [Pythium oligandrum]|uniref:Kinase n=1 Tax=Pythium oligandrum TaxID=41045 RepID=A0A8K1FLJ8_PYTOL|nr:hypothetical protein Poli38472_005793 [Pythium oligandrum]|eukprot:TMW68325.1 hypothetical protein Poli38472_005793 [Pythium oligandrum]
MDVSKFTAMAHQVGGHATTKTSLRAHGGQILKPFQSKRRGEHEYEFYQHVFESEQAQTDPLYAQLRELLPGYRGMVEITDETNAVLHAGKYLALEDLTWERRSPCIMDVKVGTRSYEDGASAEKIAYEQSKFPLQTTVGFRVQGVKRFERHENKYVELDKHAGRGVTTREELVTLFAQFFPPTNPSKSKALLTQFLQRLEKFKQWFNQQEEFEFIASSLLFLYDGESEDDGRPDIRLIDFAHVQRAASPRRDEGVLLGITTLIECFEELFNQFH